MKLCSHPNLVSYRSSFINEHSLWLVMDYLSGGNYLFLYFIFYLYSHVYLGSISDIMRHSYQNGLPDEVLIATILREALQGIAYLHSTGRIHRYLIDFINFNVNNSYNLLL